MKKKRRVLGKYIHADPSICHGQPTFIGTRVMVAQVLRQVAKGKDWEEIVKEWRGSVPKQAIAEAVELARNSIGRQARFGRRVGGPGQGYHEPR